MSVFTCILKLTEIKWDMVLEADGVFLASNLYFSSKHFSSKAFPTCPKMQSAKFHSNDLFGSAEVPLRSNLRKGFVGCCRIFCA